MLPTSCRRALWAILLMSVSLPIWLANVWALNGSSLHNTKISNASETKPMVGQQALASEKKLLLKDLLNDQVIEDSSQTTVKVVPKTTTDTTEKILIQAQGPEQVLQQSANGASLLLRTIVPPSNRSAAPAMGSKLENSASEPNEEKSAAPVGMTDLGTRLTVHPDLLNREAPAGMAELNITLTELLPTAWRYGVELSAFQGTRWQQRHRSIPLDAFTYANLKQLFFSQDGHILALTAGAQGGLDALKITADGHIQKLIPDEMARMSAVTAMDATGTTIAGWLLAKQPAALPQGFIWQQERGLTLLPPDQVLPLALSADGSQMTIDAYSADRALLRRHYQFTKLPADLPGDNRGGVFALSLDGNKAAGYISGGSDFIRGWIWDKSHGYYLFARALFISNADVQDPDKWQAFADQLTHLAGLSKAEQSSSLKTRLLQRDLDGGLKLLVKQGRLLAYAPSSGDSVWEAWDDDKDEYIGPVISRNGQTTTPLVIPDGIRPQNMMFIRLSSNGQSLLIGDTERQIVMRDQRQTIVPSSVFSDSLVMSADGRILAGISPNKDWDKPVDIFWLDLDSGEQHYFASCSAPRLWSGRQDVMLNSKGNELIFNDEIGGYCRYMIKDIK